MAVFDDCEPWETKLVVHHHTITSKTKLPKAVSGSAENISLIPNEPLKAECSHFLECVTHGKQPVTDVYEGLSVVRVLAAADEAMGRSDGVRLVPSKRSPDREWVNLIERTINGKTYSVEGEDEREMRINGNGTTQNGGIHHRDDQIHLGRHVRTDVNGVKAGEPLLSPASAVLSETLDEQGEMPFVDLTKQKLRIKQSLERRIADVLAGVSFIQGPEVFELERQLVDYTGARHVITCANGTDALTLALLALKLRPGDAVLVPTLTFVATVEPVVLLGGVPIFIDVDTKRLTIDPSLIEAGVEAARTAGYRPVGIIAVDLYGHPADYGALHAAAEAHDLWVVADAAQSFGATMRGRKVGKLANVTTTSFFPSKPLGCYGDGGAVLTDNDDIASTVRSLRLHGRGKEKNDSIRIGLNSRLDTMQAAVLLAKLEVFSDELQTRQHVAARYNSLLTGLVGVPIIQDGVVPAWAAYTVRSSDRDSLRTRLGALHIPTAIYYPHPVHRQPAYLTFPVANGRCPVADMAVGEVLSLPMHPYLETVAQDKVVEAIRESISPSSRALSRSRD